MTAQFEQRRDLVARPAVWFGAFSVIGSWPTRASSAAEPGALPDVSTDVDLSPRPRQPPVGRCRGVGAQPGLYRMGDRHRDRERRRSGIAGLARPSAGGTEAYQEPPDVTAAESTSGLWGGREVAEGRPGGSPVKGRPLVAAVRSVLMSRAAAGRVNLGAVGRGGSGRLPGEGTTALVDGANSVSCPQIDRRGFLRRGCRRLERCEPPTLGSAHSTCQSALLLAAGVTEAMIRSRVRAGDLVPVRQGAYLSAASAAELRATPCGRTPSRWSILNRSSATRARPSLGRFRPASRLAICRSR